MSDHIFLAATMLISLHTEVVCLMSDLLRVEHALAHESGGNKQQQQDSLPLSEVFLTLLLVLALFLYLFTAADMYFTAKYYHFPLVSMQPGFPGGVLASSRRLVWQLAGQSCLSASCGSCFTPVPPAVLLLLLPLQESITTTVLVFIMFQCPMLVWMIRRRQRVLAQHRG